MTKQEILTALVMAVAVRDIESMDRGTGAAIVVIVDGSRMAVVRTPRGVAVDSLTHGTHHFCMNELWAEVARLLNMPSWDDAPAEATHKAMDDDGEWCFYIGEPSLGAEVWWPAEACEPSFFHASNAIKIPAGYDWRDSLAERPE